jgi:hypothetical protein
MECGDDDFQQEWRRDLVVRWRRWISPKMGMGR